MKPFPDNMEQLIKSPEAAKLLENKDALMSLSKSPEIQQFMKMLSDKSGGNLQGMAEAAMKGDASQLSKLVNEVSKNPDVAKTMSNLNKKFPK